MQLKKAKVSYTETCVNMTAQEVADVLSVHIQTTRNLGVRPEEIQFDLAGDSCEGVAFNGITATVLKRGRAESNGRKKKADVVVDDRPETLSNGHDPDEGEDDRDDDEKPEPAPAKRGGKKKK